MATKKVIKKSAVTSAARTKRTVSGQAAQIAARQQDTSVQLMVVLFALLSIVFVVMAYWRYAIGAQ